MTTIGAYIIGDEILSGKRQDKHFGHLIQILADRGLRLSWAQYLGDNPAQIEAALRASLARDEIVFSFGGIGATPDDHTRACAARALGESLVCHEEGKQLVEEVFGADAYPHRIFMVHLPESARLIPNPVNRMPGFSVKDHHFVPGFPSMAWPMCEWVLDTYYAHLFCKQTPEYLMIARAREGDMVAIMEDFVARFPNLGFSSLPSFGDENQCAFVEFGVTGEDAWLGINFLQQALQSKNIVTEAIRSRHDDQA